MTTFVDRYGEELELPRLSLARLFGLITYFRQPHTASEASTELRLPVTDIRKLLDYLPTILVPGEHDKQAFEVTEDPSDLVDGERFSHTPELGMWRGQTGASGDVMISENRLRHLMAGGPAAFHSAVDAELGTAWDEALEPLRGHPAAAEVTWLSRVG